MIRGELERLMSSRPFEPFRMKLLNGDYHDLFDPKSLALLESGGVMIASQDGNWVIFPFDKIAAIESLFADFHGQTAEHGA